MKAAGAQRKKRNPRGEQWTVPIGLQKEFRLKGGSEYTQTITESFSITAEQKLDSTFKLINVTRKWASFLTDNSRCLL